MSPGAASGQPTPHSRLALDEGAGNATATDGGASASLSSGAYWLPAGAPSLLNTLNAAGIVVTGAAATVAVGSQVTFTVAPVDRCGVPLVGPVVSGELRLLDDVGTTTTHTGKAHPRVKERADATPTTVSYSDPGLVAGVGNLTGTYKVTRGCGAAQLHVSVNGVTAAASPFSVVVTARSTSSAAESYVVLPAEKLAPGVVVSADIVAVDAYGCPRTSGGETFVATLTRVDAAGGGGGPSAAAQSTAVVVDLSDGTYRARFAAPAEGRYALDVALRDPSTGALSALKGSPVIRDATFSSSVSLHVDGEENVGGAGGGGVWAAVVTSTTTKPEARTAPLAAWTDDVSGEVYVLGGETAGRTPLPLNEVWKVPGAVPAPSVATGAARADAFGFRRDITISGVPSVNHEIRVTVNTKVLVAAGKMRADCADASFRIAATGAVIKAWLDPQPGCGSEHTAFWLAAPSSPTTRCTFDTAPRVTKSVSAARGCFVAWATTDGAAATVPITAPRVIHRLPRGC